MLFVVTCPVFKLGKLKKMNLPNEMPKSKLYRGTNNAGWFLPFFYFFWLQDIHLKGGPNYAQKDIGNWLATCMKEFCYKVHHMVWYWKKTLQVRKRLHLEHIIR